MDGGQQAVSLVVAFTLAGLLGPHAYGVVAMAYAFVAFLEVLQRQGIGSAVIQRRALAPSHCDTAFWLVVLVSGVTAGACVALAPWWAAVNGVPELMAVVRVLSLVLVLHGLASVQEALLRRRLAFRALAFRTIVAAVAGGIAGVAAALAGAGVWALVTQQLTTAIVSLVVLWTVSGWRPGLQFSRAAARDLLGFSTGSFLASIAVFIQNRADTLLIGLFFGPYVVGVYHLAARLVESVVSALARPVQSLALPELSPHQLDAEELRRRLHRLVRLGATTTLPVLGLLSGLGPALPLLLGDAWDGLGPVLPALCVVGAVRVAVLLDGPLLQAVGRTYLLAAVTWASACLSAVTLLVSGVLLQGVAEEQQAAGVAVARACLYGTAVVVLHLWLVRTLAQTSVRAACTVLARPSAVAAAAGFAAWGALASVDEVLMPWGAAVVAVGAGAASGLAALRLLIPDVSHAVRSMTGGQRSPSVSSL